MEYEFYIKTPFTTANQTLLNHILLDEPIGSVIKTYNDRLTVIKCSNGKTQMRKLTETLMENGFTVYPINPDEIGSLLKNEDVIIKLHTELFGTVMDAIEAFEKVSVTNDRTQPLIHPKQKEKRCNTIINVMETEARTFSTPRSIIKIESRENPSYLMSTHEATAVVHAIGLAGEKYNLIKEIIAATIMPYKDALRAKRSHPANILSIIRELMGVEQKAIVTQDENGELQYHREHCDITEATRETTVTEVGFSGFRRLEALIKDAFDEAGLDTSNEQQICDEIITVLNYLIWDLDPPTFSDTNYDERNA